MVEVEFDLAVARLYDEVVASGYHNQSLYLENLLKIISPGEKVLELGCGTGMISIPLSKNGITVEGVDVSPDMLGVFRSKGEGVQTYLADIREFKPTKRYDYSLFCSGPIVVKGDEIESYFFEPQQVRGCLVKFSACADKGVLINKGVSKDSLEIELSGGRVFRHREVRDRDYVLIFHILSRGGRAHFMPQVKRRFPLEEIASGARLEEHNNFVLMRF